MPLSLYYRPSFERSRKNLDTKQARTVGLILEAIQIYYASGCDLQQAKKISSRFFYKKLRTSFYEAGVDSHLRVVLFRDGEKGIAVIAGNHDQIRQFLLEA